jgi:antitoxin VapB
MGTILKSSTLPTRIFKSGNSLAVRIPKDMMPAEVPEDAEINYSGGVWTIRPIYKRKLTGLAEKFGTFSPGFMSEGREPQEQELYDWDLSRLPAQDKAAKNAKTK